MNDIGNGDGIEIDTETRRVSRTMDLLRGQDGASWSMDDGLFSVDGAYAKDASGRGSDHDPSSRDAVRLDAEIGPDPFEGRPSFRVDPFTEDLARYVHIPDRDARGEIAMAVPHTRETLAVVSAGITDRGPRTEAALTRLDRAERSSGGDAAVNTIDRARFLRIDIALQRQASLLLVHPPRERIVDLPFGATRRSVHRSYDSELVKAFGPERTKDIHDAMHRLPKSDLMSLMSGETGSSKAIDEFMRTMGDTLRAPNRTLDAQIARNMGVEREWTVKDLAVGRSKGDVRRDVAPKVERERVAAIEARMGLAPEGREAPKTGMARLASMVTSRVRGPETPARSASMPTKGPQMPHLTANYDVRASDRGR
jgi:hypothetical protein